MLESNKCPQCNGEVKKGNKFCNSRCAAIYNNAHSEKLKQSHNQRRLPKKECLNCGIILSHRRKYCNVSCQHEFKHKQRVEKWLREELSGTTPTGFACSYVKKHLIEVYGNKCQLCGWSELNPHSNTIPVELHHRDGNFSNNHISNVLLLCPNCHSLTETSGSLNIGNGITFRN